MMFFLLLFGCKEKIPEASPQQVLRRMSLDLKGELPSIEEMQDVTDRPEQLSQYQEEYLRSPKINNRIVDWYGEKWHTLIDVFDVVHTDYYLADDQEYAFERAVGEEPLRLIASIIADDQHYSQIVTADYTMTTPLLASLWPLTLSSTHSDESWQPAVYSDGRPANGVLSTNGQGMHQSSMCWSKDFTILRISTPRWTHHKNNN